MRRTHQFTSTSRCSVPRDLLEPIFRRQRCDHRQKPAGEMCPEEKSIVWLCSRLRSWNLPRSVAIKRLKNSSTGLSTTTFSCLLLSALRPSSLDRALQSGFCVESRRRTDTCFVSDRQRGLGLNGCYALG